MKNKKIFHKLLHLFSKQPSLYNWLISFGGEATCSLPAVSERIAEVSFAKL